MTTFAHVDADCFYVSCERIRDEMLSERPVAVLGNQGACVIAASYEMKAVGVNVAMPVWKAKRICPEGLFIKRDFRWYGLLSRAMQDVLDEFSDHIEYYSVDESFLDLGSGVRNLLGRAVEMRSRMLNATGLPVSVGIGPTRTLCKLASKANKPFGALVINDANREAILSTTPVEKVNGIGHRLLKRCHSNGIYTALDFTRRAQSEIKRIFFKPGEAIWYELQGQPVFSINPERGDRKIVSRGGSLWGNYRDKKYVWGFVMRNMERFMSTLWEEQLEIRRLTLVLRRSEGGADTFTQELPDYTNDQATMMEAIQVAYSRAFMDGVSYMRMHIVGENIRNSSVKQLNLFNKEDARRHVIQQLKMKINKRFGLFTLRTAASGHAAAVFKDKVSDFEIVDIPNKHLF
ncbi:nucleotidyltransferase [Candidatus Peregrinibacteria bacterium]|jgi:DNA polymerase V|nr:nucleotidyltransferase [Candidatus Peregrinibacteria bacterium]MBT4631937.1 nucleotidyltransferase [Candidatus Peregrinibacteria bacterium]MBT5516451.1 nucleotidyltransferase [Candidatus Peregrinibacteria bacterium]MBT5823676.1 nucleotidyltransferase [Candidatus Peregrinibacteria bacterium]